MSYSNLNTSFRGKVNNYNCDTTYVTAIDDENLSSSRSEPSRRLVNAAAAMSLRPTRELFAGEFYDDEDDRSDRRRTIMDSTRGRRGIRSQIPILKSLETNRILSWIDDLAAYAVAKDDLDNEILNTYLFDIPAEEPPLSSLEALPSLNLSPELREQLEAAHEDLTAVPAEALDVVEETAATTPLHPDDDPSPPADFHLHISRDVINSIRLISPASLDSQPQLWEFLLDLTRVKSLDQAIRLLSTVAMDHKIRDPFARLFDYVAAFTKLRRRLRKLVIPEKQFILEYLKKLKPESISADLKKSVDFKQITSLSELIQESYSLLTTHLEYSSRLKSVEHLQRQERPQSSRNNFSRNRNSSRSPVRSPISNPSPYPSTPRSNFSSPTTPKFSTPRSNPNTPDKSSITCFNCNKSGHYANECRSSPARRPNPRNPTMPKNHNFRNRNTAKVSQPINAPKAHISSLLSDSDSDSPKYSRTSAKGIFQVSQKSPLLELDVLVGQKKIRGLIDTGCIKSCITSDLVDPSNGSIDKSKSNEFEVADGRIVQSLGRFHTELSLLMGNESPKGSISKLNCHYWKVLTSSLLVVTF
ncbi:hypothetical protein GEMRC1_011111 [Eukaryota sp. GEM-RC1]